MSNSSRKASPKPWATELAGLLRTKFSWPYIVNVRFDLDGDPEIDITIEGHPEPHCRVFMGTDTDENETRYMFLSTAWQGVGGYSDRDFAGVGEEDLTRVVYHVDRFFAFVDAIRQDALRQYELTRPAGLKHCDASSTATSSCPCC